jgi:hypothetical protein
MTLSLLDTQYCNYDERSILFIVTLNVVMLSVITLYVVMLSVIILYVVMLSVVVTKKRRTKSLAAR